MIPVDFKCNIVNFSKVNFFSNLLLFLIIIFFNNYDLLGQEFNLKTEEKINQTITKSESGVIIYKSQGVENSQPTYSSKEILLNDKIVEKISEWNNEKCTNVLYDINRKISFLESINSTENEISGYRKTKDEILDRQRVLNNVNIKR